MVQIILVFFIPCQSSITEKFVRARSLLFLIGLLDVFVSVQMIHTIFIAALAFGAVTEFHPRTVLVRASADRADMARAALGPDLGAELLLALDLPGAYAPVIPGHYKENDKVGQGQQNFQPTR